MSFLAQHFFHMFCFDMSVDESPSHIIFVQGTKTVWCSVPKFNLQFFVHWWAPLRELWCQQSPFSVSGVECCLYWISGIFHMASNWLISSLMGAALTIPQNVQIHLHAWCNDKLLHGSDCEHVRLAQKSVSSSDILVAMFQCHGCSRARSCCVAQKFRFGLFGLVTSGWWLRSPYLGLALHPFFFSRTRALSLNVQRNS